jgi:hypothetical protein
MGYYSTMDYCRFVTNKTVEEMSALILSKVDDPSIEDSDYLDIYSFVIEEKITQNLNLASVQVEDWCTKHYADEGLANIIKELISPGYYAILSFVGEDSQMWGFFITSEFVLDISYQILLNIGEEKMTLDQAKKSFNLVDSSQVI